MQIGLQTFTVRKLLRTPKDVDTTFRAVAALGVENLEIAVDYLNFPFTEATARMLAEAAARHGLRVASCQIKYETASADIAKTAEWMHILGAKTAVNSVIDLALLAKGREGVLRCCGRLNDLAKRLAAHDIAFAHHNHHYEFTRTNGQIVLDIMTENFDGVGLALDTYWCQKGGGNVIELLERLHGRVPVMHLRDFALSRAGLLTGGTDAAIGEGAIPFGAVLKAAEAAGVGCGMIEQKTKRPMEDVGKSVKALSIIRKA